jgi:cysteine desulfurase
VGFAKSVQICHKEMNKEGKRLSRMRDKITGKLLSTIPDSYLNGHPDKCLPNIINLRFTFVEGEAILMELDSYGIAVSTASACASAKLAPSHVLLACGLKAEQAHGSLRISLGRFTTEKEVKYLTEILPKIIIKLRNISPFKRLHNS